MNSSAWLRCWTFGSEPRQPSCTHACYDASVPKTVQIRNIDDDTYSVLSVRAARAGTSVPDLLRREATKYGARPTVEEWLEGLPFGANPQLTAESTVSTLDEIRIP